jgi:uncharacterized protein YdeI (BOF family)
MKNSRLHVILLLCLFTGTSILAQQNPYEESIADIIKLKNENQPVMLTAMVTKWLDESRFVVDDLSGTINVVINSKEKPDLIQGDEISISGKVALTESGEKEILLRTYRKLKFIKNPANCCRPELD